MVESSRGMKTPPAVRGAAESGEAAAAPTAIAVSPSSAIIASQVQHHLQHQHQPAPPSSLASLPPLPLGEVDLDLCYGDIVSEAFNIDGRGEFERRAPFFILA